MAATRRVQLTTNQWLTAIQMLGETAELTAEAMRLPAKSLPQFKKNFDEITRRIEAGTTPVDIKLLQSVFDRANGFQHDEIKHHYDGTSDAWVSVKTVKQYPPDTTALKLLMTNRKPGQWKERNHTSLSGGTGDESAVGLKIETRNELLDSIAALVNCKPDNPVKTND